MSQDIALDYTLRKMGDEFTLIHIGTGIHVKGRDLNVLYSEIENKKRQYLSDIEAIGAKDLLLKNLHSSAGQQTVVTTAAGGLGLKNFFIKFAIVLVLLVAILQTVFSKVDRHLKDLELKVRNNLENPTPEQTAQRMTKLKETLKRADPYLIEIKKHWNQLPNEAQK